MFGFLSNIGLGSKEVFVVDCLDDFFGVFLVGLEIGSHAFRHSFELKRVFKMKLEIMKIIVIEKKK